MRKQAIWRIAVFSLLVLFTAMPSHARSMNILVQPFQNTGDAQFAWISAGMTDMVASDLNRVRNINVIPDRDRKKLLEVLKFTHSGLTDEERIVKTGRVTGADVIFTGSLKVSGKRILVDARLINVATGKVESSTRLEGTINRLLNLQQKVLFSLMDGADKVKFAGINPVKLVAEDKREIEQKYKPKAEAYRWYSKGVEASDRDFKLALDYFNRAIKVDPNYTDPLMQAACITGSVLNRFDEAHKYLEKADGILKSRKETISSDYATLLMKIGVVCLQEGQPDLALPYFQDSKTLHGELGLQDKVSYSTLMIKIGHAYRSKRQLDAALEYFESSKVILERLGLQKTDRYLNNMMDIGGVYLSKGEFNTAVTYLHESESIQRKIALQNTDGYAALMMNIGIVYRDRGDPELALKYFQDSQAIKDSLGLQNTESYSALIMNIGIVYLNRGQLDLALKYFQDSKAIKDRLGLRITDGYSTLLMNIGILYSNKWQLDLALKYYQDSQTIKDRLNLQNTVDYSILMMNIGVAYDKKGQPDLALKCYQDSKEIKDRLGLKNTIDYSNLMMDIGGIYWDKGQLEEALKYYQDSQVIKDRLGLQYTVAYGNLLYSLALVCEKQGQRNRAGMYFRKAYDTYKKVGYSGPWKDNALRNAERLGY